MTATRRLLRFTALLITVAVTACHRDPAVAEREFVARADRYMAAGQVEAAILEYRNAIAKLPSAADAHYKLALAYEKTRALDKAMREFMEVTELDGGNVDAHVRVASVLLAAGRFEDAERLVNRVLARDPRNIRALSLAATALASGGKAVSAAKRVSEALAVDPHSATALIARASLERRRGDVAAARRTLGEALEAEPQAVDAWIALGSLEEEAGNVDAASDALEKAFAASTDKAGARRLLASFHLRTGHEERAEPHLRALAEISATDRLVLADYYLARNKQDLAATILEGLLGDKELAAEARLRRAALAGVRGRLSEAGRELTYAIGNPATEVRARLATSELLLHLSLIHI